MYLLITLSACQTLGSVVQEPKFSIRSVDLDKISFTEINLVFKVNVENPNPVTIPFPEVDWEFFINENSFIKGTVKNESFLKARKITVVEVPVSLAYMEVLNTFKSLKGAKEAGYKVALAAKFALPVLGDKIWRLEHEGVFPVIQIPKISAPSLKIGKMDFTAVELFCSLNVENPNKFDLPFPGMEYDYTVNKNSFIKSSVQNPSVLAAGAVVPVVVQLKVNYADLYKGFQSLKNSAEAQGLLSMKTDFNIPAFSGESSLLEIPGSLPLLKAPSIGFKGIALENIGLTKLEFDLSWEVENNNNFAMSVKDFVYDFKVNNSRWAAGKITGAPVIAANKKTVIPLTISLESLSMVREITEIITKGNDVAYSCNGNINLGSSFPGLNDFLQPFNFTGVTKLRK
jgi:LEA14-like dessication related protein